MSDKQDNNKKKDDKNKNQNLLIIIILAVIFACVLLLIRTRFTGTKEEEVTYDQFTAMVEEGSISKVVVKDGKLLLFMKNEKGEPEEEYSKTVRLIGTEDGLNELLKDTGIEYSKETASAAATALSSVISLVIPLLIFILFLNVVLKRTGGMMGFARSKAKPYVQKETGVTFADVAGEDEAKESLQEMVEFLHNPEKYKAIGAALPKGALLVGPPGTGKTLLARAVAGEANVPFFSISGSEFVEMFVGVGASRVRDLFEEAKKESPCIIFIDEIDAIGKTRDSRYGGNDEREQTLNQLLAEMDGFDNSSVILILAATNRPEVLDPALLRPGRFDRRIIVDRPDIKGRIEILKVHAQKIKLDDTVDFRELALATAGVVGSDLANIINEGAILAVKYGREAVSQKDLLEAVEVVLVGKEKKDRVLSEKEKRIVSYHEVGHALVTALQKDAEPVQKITIVPRTMGALGYVMQVPEEEKYLNTRTELEAMVVSALAGRAAEELVFDSVTTGAENDIERATEIVRAMITRYGMSDTFGLMSLEKEANRYLDNRMYLTCGDATATEIDHETMRLLKEFYVKAKELLSANRDVLDKIADFLIERETITGAEFMEIFHQVQAEREEIACPS
ncbi:MAG: ATP-dependent zinc metalloprotease FtsH [Eubacterium sp.]|nr:ATP-dependent zinc metalloprotease FtsH [Eubacterium sp.]